MVCCVLCCADAACVCVLWRCARARVEVFAVSDVCRKRERVTEKQKSNVFMCEIQVIQKFHLIRKQEKQYIIQIDKRFALEGGETKQTLIFPYIFGVSGTKPKDPLLYLFIYFVEHLATTTIMVRYSITEYIPDRCRLIFLVCLTAY